MRAGSAVAAVREAQAQQRAASSDDRREPLALRDHPRHCSVVRITHWLTAVSFAGLLISGFAILLAHPRLYWGETGAVGTDSIIDLPLPFVLTGQSGWGRYLHFLSAWVCVLTGLIYALYGFCSQHFRNDLLPAPADLSWTSLSRVVSNHLHLKLATAEAFASYNVLQRFTYLMVVFVLFPFMIWTGLAMSPAITSVFPVLVNLLSGQQSARTIHFVVAGFLVLFFVVHVAMVCAGGFRSRVRAMITGYTTSIKVRA